MKMVVRLKMVVGAGAGRAAARGRAHGDAAGAGRGGRDGRGAVGDRRRGGAGPLCKM